MNTELLAKVGVDLSNMLSVESLVKMQGYYETLNASLVTEKEAAKASDTEGDPIKDAFRSEVAANEGYQEIAKTVMAAIRDLLATAMTDSPYTALLFSDAIKVLSTEMTAEKIYQEAIALKDADIPAVEIDLPEDWSDRRNEASEVADLIRKVFGLVKDEASAKGSKFKTKVSKTEGTLPDLTKLVRDVKEDSDTALVGRAATNSRIVYKWNGEVVPTTMMNEVLHDYVSDFRSGYVVTFSDLRDKVKAAGYEAYAKAAEAGTDIVFDTGTLNLSMQAK